MSWPSDRSVLACFDAGGASESGAFGVDVQDMSDFLSESLEILEYL
jgi:hypothetical protein